MSRTLTGVCALVLGAGLLPALAAPAAAQAAPVGQGFNLNTSDLKFILKQIKIAEEHTRTATPANPCGTLLGTGPDQIPNQNGAGGLLPFGLRTVDGTCNNLQTGQARLGAADNTFPRQVPAVFRDAEPVAPGFGPPGPSSYQQKSGSVFDSKPRTASNLIVDQTKSNPAAIASATAEVVANTPVRQTLSIPNVAPDVGLSAPFNGWFTLFGQFFDHGLDLTNKGGSGTVFTPLKGDDPLIAGDDGIFGNADDLPSNQRFTVLTRSTNRPGPDGILGNADDIQDATNQSSTFVDQSQTYTSHPSHQVFLREYVNAATKPVSTGKMAEGPDGGLATWASTKAQARTLLGIALSDQDVLNVPLLATDQYGKFLPGPNGLPQLVKPAAPGGLVEGNLTTPVDTAGATKTGHAFLDDIAHHAAPFGDHDGNPQTPRQNLTADAEPGTGDDGLPGTYDNEMLDAHFLAGDGRLNENIGLTAVHQVFHSEHNRLAGTDIPAGITASAEPAFVAEWKLPDGSWNGERLFQAARFVTEMEYQHLAFEEFARKVQPQVNLFAGYDSAVNPAITAEFAHAVYRFGHSMLTETVARKTTTGADKSIPLLGAFLNPPAYTTNGTDPVLTPRQAAGNIVRGMTDQVGNEIDEFVTEALRNKLLGLPLDLATLNMVRGREAGISSLNASRRQFHATTNGNSALAPYANWLDYGLEIKHPESLINFVAAYGKHSTVTGADTMVAKRQAAARLVAGDPLDPATPPDSAAFMNGTAYTPATPPGPGEMAAHSTWVSGADGVTTTGLDDVDLWVGGLAEKVSPFGGLLGSSLNYVFELQMENLQDGDRFYYLSRTAGLNMLVQLEGNSFAELISRNTDAQGLPADVFSRPDLVFDLAVQNASGAIVDDPATAYNETTLLTRMADGTIRYAGPLHAVFNGSTRDDLARSSEGDDTLRGNDANDKLEGGAGNDSFIGGLGDDILLDTFGDDVLKGGDGNDALSSGQGFDLNQPGRGDDFVVGGSDPTETFGGPGNDFIFGGDSSDTVFGDDGDDWIEGGNQADLLQGDNGAPFQDDPNAPGHDVIVGGGGNDDYDSEGGDDVMVAGPGIERNEGMLGFDWTTHVDDPQAAADDMKLTGLLPPSVDTLSDRFDIVEGLSGWNLADNLKGDDVTAETTAPGNSLTADGVARIAGLAGLLPAPAPAPEPYYTGGNILLGGGGNDLIEGRGGDDIIDGDQYLNVRLSVRTDGNNPATEIGSAAGMSKQYLRNAAGALTGPTLQQAVFSRTVNPGNIRVVREIVPGSSGADTAVFTGPRSSYSVTIAPDKVTVVQTAANATGQVVSDGTDTLRNIESLKFSDVTVPVSNTAAATFTAVGPTRELDTRSGTGVPAGPVGPAGTVTMDLNAPVGATAAVFNLTGTELVGAPGSFVSACPAAQPLADCTTTSALNVTAGVNIANMITVPIAADGMVRLYNDVGSIHLVADLAGYLSAGYTSVAPTRVLDTRTLLLGRPASKVGPGGSVVLDFPAAPAGTSAVVFNLTGTRLIDAGTSFVSACPADKPVADCKTTSALNVTAGTDIANMVTVPIDANKQVRLYNDVGSIDLVADLAGYLTAYTPVGPTRVLDTRTGLGAPAPGKVGSGDTRTLTVPNVPAGATAVTFNLTGVELVGAGSTFVSACPATTLLAACKTTSALNATAGVNIANMITVPITDGRVTLYNEAGAIDLLADVAGFFTG